MADILNPSVKVVSGRQVVNGVPGDFFSDTIEGTAVISNYGDEARLAATAFEAGRQYERELAGGILAYGEAPIDGPAPGKSD